MAPPVIVGAEEFVPDGVEERDDNFPVRFPLVPFRKEPRAAERPIIDLHLLPPAWALGPAWIALRGIRQPGIALWRAGTLRRIGAVMQAQHRNAAGREAF